MNADRDSIDNGWDSNSLNKKGDGTLVLNGQNTYTSSTEVQSGKLVIGGSVVDSTARIAGDVNVHSWAVLVGHGAVLGYIQGGQRFVWNSDRCCSH